MGSRFNQQKANLRSYLRNRGAKIDVKRQTIRIDVESLNRKELERLKELERWGYKVNEENKPLPLFDLPVIETEYFFEEESFVAFADEIIEQYG